MTNFEKIKEMNVDDFAEFLDKIISAHDDYNDCIRCPLRYSDSCYYGGFKRWLNSTEMIND